MPDGRWLLVLGLWAALSGADRALAQAPPPVPVAPATAAADTFGWRNRAVASVTFNQASFTNWQAGGASNVSLAGSLRSNFEEVKPNYIWRNLSNLEYGIVKQDNEDLQKSIDVIEFESLYTRRVEFSLKPYASAGLKTQFSTGRDYDEKTGSSNGEPIFPVTSDFADPLYLSQSAGVGYTVIPGVMTTRFGGSLRETLTDDFRGYAIDDDEEEKGLDFDDCINNPDCDQDKIELGLESVTEYARKWDEEAIFTSRLGLFWAFKQPDELDFNWRSDLVVKLLGMLNVNFGLELQYDDDVVQELQIKQLLGLGISYTLL
ncbi:MAG TPA: DUF3078 domain-containing protein [Candidatus Udaeobacter sp.]|nr:DUF3078 domain-containing protein [Candidatus Udaeobacter sp.]